ncbi:Papain-like cysteine peptidase, partial [Klenkia terrae]
VLTLDAAVDLTRTGDVWLFRGASVADRAIQTLTNAPVNHVGMAVVLEDLPPLLWHAELGRSLPDAWTGTHQRGVQLHDLRDAVSVWRQKYGQRAWLRQLVGPAPDGGLTPAMEDAVLTTIARLDGRPFPTTRGLVRGFANGLVDRRTNAETVFCAELVAATYTAMGLLPDDRPLNSYDPGSFWSGDRLELVGGQLGPEVAVDVPSR